MPMSALPGRGSAPGPAPARADEPAAESTRGSRASVVRRRGGEPAGARWGAPGGTDHRPGSEDDPAWPGGSRRGVGGRADQAAAATARGWPSAGRKKDPAVLTALQEVVEPVTAGDPMSEQKWVRASLRGRSRRLGEAGHPASPPTVRRLLDDRGYRLHANTKQLESSAAHPDRDRQFEYIAEQRQVFGAAGRPRISVDTKKKELIGQFKNAGRVWGQEAEAVNVHDFRTDALGRAVPYGIYDLTHNRGTIYVGQSADTPRFAGDMVARWWADEGQAAFPDASELLILADSGGSNSARSRVWKQQLQEQLCDRYGLAVTVCHYPTGCSKWNPIEHRLFGPISQNWAGRPLATWDTMLGYLQGTTTQTGLSVRAALHDGVYQTGESVSDAGMATLNLTRHDVCPTWNYTLRPRSSSAADSATDCASRELVL